MIKVFGREKAGRQVPKCQECKSDKYVCLSTYKTIPPEKYWECCRCHCVIKQARLK